MQTEEKQLTEQESLKLITEMINKAKGSYHESGLSPILWGTAVGIAGITSFAERYWNFDIGFDIWWIMFLGFVPQTFISIWKSKTRKVISHHESYQNSVWMVFGITLMMFVFYLHAIPGISVQLMKEEGQALFVKELQTGQLSPQMPFVLSSQSFFLLLYAMPTLITGLAHKFRPMIIASIFCYILFIVSCYVNFTYDLLLNGIAGICNWLIPGIILRRRYLKGKAC